MDVVSVSGGFFENGISYKVFAVSNSKEIRTNSGIALVVDDVIANLKGHEDDFDAMVFSCGDAIPQFAQHAGESYNQDLMAVIAAFGQKEKIMIGHCAGAMLFDMAGGHQWKDGGCPSACKASYPRGKGNRQQI